MSPFLTGSAQKKNTCCPSSSLIPSPTFFNWLFIFFKEFILSLQYLCPYLLYKSLLKKYFYSDNCVCEIEINEKKKNYRLSPFSQKHLFWNPSLSFAIIFINRFCIFAACLDVWHKKNLPPRRERYSNSLSIPRCVCTTIYI